MLHGCRVQSRAAAAQPVIGVPGILTLRHRSFLFRTATRGAGCDFVVTLGAPGMTAQNSQWQGDSLLLRKLISLSAIIVIANFLIGIFAPIFYDIEDEIGYLDTLWRVVSGQRVGIDYHNPMGFGPYQLGALLWHWLGPHYYVMRLAVTLFNLSIAFCGCIVAARKLARRVDLALLFCATLAFQLSEPTIFGNHILLGMSGFYNRQIVAALAVLFLLTFSGGSRLSRGENALEIALFAFLLNVLFLIKISGLVVGLMILLAGCLLQGRAVYRLLNLCAALLLFGAITAIELKVTGLELLSDHSRVPARSACPVDLFVHGPRTRCGVFRAPCDFRSSSRAFCSLTAPRRSAARFPVHRPHNWDLCRMSVCAEHDK